MITTVSQIKDFWACPQRWYLKHVNPKREPRQKGVALFAGIMWHRFMEKLLAQDPASCPPNSPERAALVEWLTEQFRNEMSDAIAAGQIDRSEQLRKECDSLVAAGALWEQWMPCETLGIEVPFELDLANYGGPAGAKVRGRLDHVARFMGRLGHQQHRTLARSKSVERYLATFHRNPYECVYWHMLRDQYGEDPFGTLLDLTRKLVPKSISKSPAEALQQHPVPIDEETARKGLDNVARTVAQMMRFAERPELSYSNPDMDLGKFGNSNDPYFEAVDTGDIDYMMDDERWQTTQNRYTELDEGSES